VGDTVLGGELQGPFDAPDHVFELAAWDRLLN
jgi:hypothetical protein